MEKKELVWMPLEEALKYQEFMRQAEIRCLEANGLGWLLEFLRK